MCTFCVKMTLERFLNQGVTRDLETGGQNLESFKFRMSKVIYPIYRNDHSNVIY